MPDLRVQRWPAGISKRKTARLRSSRRRLCPILLTFETDVARSRLYRSQSLQIIDIQVLIFVVFSNLLHRFHNLCCNFANFRWRTQIFRFFVKFSEKFLGISQKFKDFDKGYSKIIIFQSNLRNLLNFRRNSVQNFVSHRFQKSGDWDTVEVRWQVGRRMNDELNSPPIFERLVLGCIDADFCK